MTLGCASCGRLFALVLLVRLSSACGDEAPAEDPMPEPGGSPSPTPAVRPGAFPLLASAETAPPGDPDDPSI